MRSKSPYQVQVFQVGNSHVVVFFELTTWSLGRVKCSIEQAFKAECKPGENIIRSDDVWAESFACDVPGNDHVWTLLTRWCN
jgi:hypothetical protein